VKGRRGYRGSVKFSSISVRTSTGRPFSNAFYSGEGEAGLGHRHRPDAFRQGTQHELAGGIGLGELHLIPARQSRLHSRPLNHRTPGVAHHALDPPSLPGRASQSRQRRSHRQRQQASSHQSRNSDSAPARAAPEQGCY